MSSLERIRQELQCSICRNTITDPRTLQCSHTFCKGCLENHYGSRRHGYRGERQINCPSCRQTTRLRSPGSGVASLPTNFVLKSVAQILEAREAGHECEPTATLNSASGRPQLVCKQHSTPQQPTYLDSFCEACWELVCYKCMYSPRHRSHKQSFHNALDLLRYRARPLKASVNVITNKATSVRRKLLAVREGVSKNRDEIIAAIETAYQKKLALFLRRKQNLLAAVSENAMDKLSAVEQCVREQEGARDKFDQTAKAVIQLIETEDLSFLVKEPSLTKELEACHQTFKNVDRLLSGGAMNLNLVLSFEEGRNIDHHLSSFGHLTECECDHDPVYNRAILRVKNELNIAMTGEVPTMPNNSSPKQHSMMPPWGPYPYPHTQTMAGGSTNELERGYVTVYPGPHVSLPSSSMPWERDRANAGVTAEGANMNRLEPSLRSFSRKSQTDSVNNPTLGAVDVHHSAEAGYEYSYPYVQEDTVTLVVSQAIRNDQTTEESRLPQPSSRGSTEEVQSRQHWRSSYASDEDTCDRCPTGVCSPCTSRSSSNYSLQSWQSPPCHSNSSLDQPTPGVPTTGLLDELSVDAPPSPQLRPTDSQSSEPHPNVGQDQSELCPREPQPQSELTLTELPPFQPSSLSKLHSTVAHPSEPPVSADPQKQPELPAAPQSPPPPDSTAPHPYETHPQSPTAAQHWSDLSSREPEPPSRPPLAEPSPPSQSHLTQPQPQLEPHPTVPPSLHSTETLGCNNKSEPVTEGVDPTSQKGAPNELHVYENYHQRDVSTVTPSLTGFHPVPHPHTMKPRQEHEEPPCPTPEEVHALHPHGAPITRRSTSSELSLSHVEGTPKAPEVLPPAVDSCDETVHSEAVPGSVPDCHEPVDVPRNPTGISTLPYTPDSSHLASSALPNATSNSNLQHKFSPECTKKDSSSSSAQPILPSEPHPPSEHFDDQEDSYTLMHHLSETSEVPGSHSTYVSSCSESPQDINKWLDRCSREGELPRSSPRRSSVGVGTHEPSTAFQHSLTLSPSTSQSLLSVVSSQRSTPNSSPRVQRKFSQASPLPPVPPSPEFYHPLSERQEQQSDVPAGDENVYEHIHDPPRLLQVNSSDVSMFQCPAYGAPKLKSTSAHVPLLGRSFHLSLARNELPPCYLNRPQDEVIVKPVQIIANHQFRPESSTDVRPSDVCCTGTYNNIIITDQSNHCLRVVNKNGGFATRIDGREGGDVCFNAPVALAVTTDNSCYVVDQQNTRIQKIAVYGTLQLKFGEKKGRQILRKPQGIAIRPATGDVYVADSEKRRVYVYGSDGAYIRPIGKNEKTIAFNCPVSVAITKSDHLLVVDRSTRGSSRNRVWCIRQPEEELIRRFGEGILQNPSGIAVTDDGTIFVSEVDNGTVCVFSREGELIRRFGRMGVEPGMFNQPCGICINNEGQVIIADKGNNRVQVFRLKDILRQK